MGKQYDEDKQIISNRSLDRMNEETLIRCILLCIFAICFQCFRHSLHYFISVDSNLCTPEKDMDLQNWPKQVEWNVRICVQ